MMSLHRQHDYTHHSSAQWKPWEALRCLSEPIMFVEGISECRRLKVGLMFGCCIQLVMMMHV